MHLKPHNVVRKTKPGKYGLGDAVAAVAQPVAKAIDKVAKTNLRNCLGCKERKAALNEAVPSLNPVDYFKKPDA